MWKQLCQNGARRLKPESLSLASRECGGLTGNIAGSFIVKNHCATKRERSSNGTARVLKLKSAKLPRKKSASKKQSFGRFWTSRRSTSVYLRLMEPDSTSITQR